MYASMELERVGLLKVADDCRQAADEIDARAPKDRTRSFLGDRGNADTD
jgi:hypothetical protein